MRLLARLCCLLSARSCVVVSWFVFARARVRLLACVPACPFVSIVGLCDCVVFGCCVCLRVCGSGAAGAFACSCVGLCDGSRARLLVCAVVRVIVLLPVCLPLGSFVCVCVAGCLFACVVDAVIARSCVCVCVLLVWWVGCSVVFV